VVLILKKTKINNFQPKWFKFLHQRAGKKKDKKGGGLTRVFQMRFSVLMALAVLVASCALLAPLVEGNPMAVCIRNCAQCKKMFGDYFEGQMCADWCVKFKGKLIPDCEDIDTIAQFLNKLE